MTGSPDPINADSDRERDAHAYQVVYLAKRPTYEFIFAVPEAQPPDLNEGSAVFQVHSRHRPQGQGFILDLQGLEDFYESLSRLMEYVRLERQKHRGRY